MKQIRKRLCAMALALVFILEALPVAASAEDTASGTCGPGLTWSFNSATGKLTISGAGEMEDYPYGDPPWTAYRGQIKAVEVEQGITKIGECAFYKMAGLTAAVLPETLRIIGESAFSGCESLKAIELPITLVRIDRSAFHSCKSLKSITFPSGLTEMGPSAFYFCVGLTEVTIPESLLLLPSSAFSRCTALESVYLPEKVPSMAYDAFALTSIKHVYYDGTRNKWENTVAVQLPDSSIFGLAEIHCLDDPSPSPTPMPTPSPKPKPTLRPTPKPYNPYQRFEGVWEAEQEFSYTLDNGKAGTGTWHIVINIASISRYIDDYKAMCSVGFTRIASLDGTPYSGVVSGAAGLTGPIINGSAEFAVWDAVPDCSIVGSIIFSDDGIISNLSNVAHDLPPAQITHPNTMLQYMDMPQNILLHKEGFQPGPPVEPSGPQVEGSTPFLDVYKGDWFVPAVQYAYTEALFNGTSATTFSPNDTMTRAQVAQVLANRTDGYSKETYGGATCFADVSTDFWGCAPIRWAYRNDLADGVGNNNFSPNSPLTREQFAVFLYRYAKRTGADTSSGGGRYGQFADTNTVSLWAQEAMQWAVNQGIINGSGGQLNPQGSATRAQVAQMFLNAKDVLTSTQLLPGEERPDPDLTPPLLDKIDVDFVLSTLVTVNRSIPSNPNGYTTENWHDLCESWLWNANCRKLGYKGFVSPVGNADILGEAPVDGGRCRRVSFSRNCLDKAITLFGGEPSAVLTEVSAYRPTQGEEFWRIYTTNNTLEFIISGAGIDPPTAPVKTSIKEEDGKVTLQYSFSLDPLGDVPPIQYVGTAVLVRSNNSLGYQIESFSAKRF